MSCLNGAGIIFNPSATVAGLSEIFEARAARPTGANGYFVGALNRVGTELRGTSVSFTAKAILRSRGQILATGSRDSTTASSPSSIWTRSARCEILAIF